MVEEGALVPLIQLLQRERVEAEDLGAVEVEVRVVIMVFFWMVCPREDGEALELGPEEEQVPAAKRLFVCAECAHAQLFALRPLAVCTHEWSCLRGRVLYAGRPACEQVLPRNGSQGAASWYKRDEQS